MDHRIIKSPNSLSLSLINLIMLERYSIVFHPPLEIIEQVEVLKSDLGSAIGWFPSRNSKAHITIQEFMVDESKLKLIVKQLERCCNSLQPTTLKFNAFDHFNNGAFYIKPAMESATILTALMKQIQKTVPTPNTHRGTNPHLTIARRLSPENIIIAHQILKPIEITFLCDTVALRQFNASQKQFEVIQLFPFLNQADTLGVQGSLF